jgi:outer membrane protein OmpA-like peptidoglycan-associated protein
VPNPSFEDTHEIPCHLIFKTTFFDKAMHHWHCPTGGTADIWSLNIDPSCTNFALGNQTYTNFQAKKPTLGNILPHSGHNMIGMAAAMPKNNYREYAQVKLLSPLIPSQKYKVVFWIARAMHTLYAANGLGVAFSKTPIQQQTNKALTQLMPVVYCQNIAKSTDWQKVEGNFIAQDSLSYLLIGNFFDNKNTYLTHISHPLEDEFDYTAFAAYYFVDDISLLPVTENDTIAINTAKLTQTKQQDNEQDNNQFAGFNQEQNSNRGLDTLFSPNESFTQNQPITSQKNIEIIPNQLIELENYLFEKTATNLTQDGENLLKKIANFLQENEILSISLFFHALLADEKQSLKITEKRAKIVKAFLVRQNIDKNRIYTEFFGQAIQQQSANRQKKVIERTDILIAE